MKEKEVVNSYNLKDYKMKLELLHEFIYDDILNGANDFSLIRIVPNDFRLVVYKTLDEEERRIERIKELKAEINWLEQQNKEEKENEDKL